MGERPCKRQCPRSSLKYQIKMPGYVPGLCFTIAPWLNPFKISVISIAQDSDLSSVIAVKL
jgi:hypothetical protein